MTDPLPKLDAMLPHPLPAGASARLVLFGMRRMAAGGLEDAHAAHAFLARFGLGYRQPLLLLRAAMAELSRVSAMRIAVAPCCCPRLTVAEHVLLTAMAEATTRPDDAHAALCSLLKVRHCLGLVTSLQAIAQCFADRGLILDDCESCTPDEAF